MLWGQLDGAEPHYFVASQGCRTWVALVRDAQRRILEEHYGPVSTDAVLGCVGDRRQVPGAEFDTLKC
jgi:hypothetical protein